MTSANESVPHKLFLSASKEFSLSVKDLRVVVVVVVVVVIIVVVVIMVLVCNSRPSTKETFGT